MPEGVVWKDTPDGYKAFIKDPFGHEKPVIWAPQPGSQEAFLTCPVGEALYEGERGPGKTDALLMDFGQHVGQGFGADWKGIIFRRTFPELEDIIEKSQRWYPLIWPDAVYNKQNHSWEWKTGEKLLFRHFYKVSDYWSYHGHAYPFIGWEELTTWPDAAGYLKMMSCNRSTNPRIPLKIRATTNPYGCIPYGEVLTASRGWIPIADIHVGESVISCRPDGVLCSATVEHVVKKEWTGDMVSRIGSGLHMVFTDDHRLPHMSTNREQHEVKPFTDLPGEAVLRRTGMGWMGKAVTTLTIPFVQTTRKTRLQQPREVLAEDFAELLGWYVSEGSLVDNSGKAFAISQMKEANRVRIKTLLDRIGFTYSLSENQFMVYDESWYEFFNALGRYCTEKSIPRSFLELERRVLEKFLEVAMLGDGSENTYYTTSRTLADQMAEIGVKLGKAVYIHTRTQPNRVHASYEVRFSERDSVTLLTGNPVYAVNTSNKSVNVLKEPYSGTVYCLTVPETETFFIRQNGCVWLSGNCGHNWVKHRFRLPILRGKIVGPIINDSIGLDGDIEPPRVAIHGYLAENKILLKADPKYVSRLKAAASSPAELKAWLEGSWDILAGGMFDDLWNPRVHVVPNFPAELIPRSWKIFRAYDHGSARPFSMGVYAVSSGEPLMLDGKPYGVVRGDIFRIREWYGWNGRANEGCKLSSLDIAAGIKDRIEDWGLTGRVRPGPADSAIFDPYEGTKSVAGDMAKKGVKWIPVAKGPGSRKNGWEQVRTYLKGALPDAESMIREEPGLFICECCTHFIRTVPVLSRDAKDPDDVDTDSEDHAGDEVRYALRKKTNELKQGVF